MFPSLILNRKNGRQVAYNLVQFSQLEKLKKDLMAIIKEYELFSNDQIDREQLQFIINYFGFEINANKLANAYFYCIISVQNEEQIRKSTQQTSKKIVQKQKKQSQVIDQDIKEKIVNNLSEWLYKNINLLPKISEDTLISHTKYKQTLDIKKKKPYSQRSLSANINSSDTQTQTKKQIPKKIVKKTIEKNFEELLSILEDEKNIEQNINKLQSKLQNEIQYKIMRVNIIELTSNKDVDEVDSKSFISGSENMYNLKKEDVHLGKFEQENKIQFEQQGKTGNMQLDYANFVQDEIQNINKQKDAIKSKLKDQLKVCLDEVLQDKNAKQKFFNSLKKAKFSINYEQANQNKKILQQNAQQRLKLNSIKWQEKVNSELDIILKTQQNGCDAYRINQMLNDNYLQEVKRAKSCNTKYDKKQESRLSYLLNNKLI